MPIEHEAKSLDVNPAALEQLIVSKGSEKLGERLPRSHVYDVAPGDPTK